jgi:hypothetical protein
MKIWGYYPLYNTSFQLYHWAPDYVFGKKYYKEDNTLISSNSAFGIDEIIGCDVIDKSNEETLGKD